MSLILKKSAQFANALGIESPVIVQAPMAGLITTPELVAKIANAKGLGSFATGYLATVQVEEGIKKIKQLTSEIFAVNLFIPHKPQENPEQINQYFKIMQKFREKLNLPQENILPQPLLPQDNFREIIEVILEQDVKIVSFTFGNLPLDIIKILKQKKIYLIGTANSIADAKVLENSGIDAVVAQGYEAGGHQGGFITKTSTATMALIPQIADAVKIPVIAAGGIMDNRGILAALALGASAVQMGTAFLATKESGANPTYKKILAEQAKNDFDNTVMTDVFSGKQARALNAEFIRKVNEAMPEVPEYPIPHFLSNAIRREAAKQNMPELMSMWCGQGVPLITSGLAADELLIKLREECSCR